MARRRGLIRTFGAWFGLALCALLAAGVWLWSYGGGAGTRPPSLEIPGSRLVLDRQGRPLRVFTVAPGRVRLPVEVKSLDQGFIAMLLAMEDRRFLSHPGVDALALARSAYQLATRGRILSGGSTISMQVVRLLGGLETRSPTGKLLQIRSALALERRADKDAILTAYLTVAPYGGNLEGLRAGSLAWLGKEPRRLSAAESALLVALPQAPEARRPDRHPDAARQARDRILARVLALGLIDPETESVARREPIPTQRRPFPLLAPHVTERLTRAYPDRAELRLTLDSGLQSRLETLAAERASALGPRVSVAILAADHRSGEVLASVGSAGLLEGDRAGFVDMTLAPRSPGSALKPLIYGLAFELGLAHPESLIEDRPTTFSGYAPENFDRGFQGTVTVRRALALSLNVPAVQLLDAVGPARLVARMRRAGADPRLPDATPPGLAIGLGGVGVTLTDLVRIYGAIARGGRALPLRELRDPTPPKDYRSQARVLDEGAAWHLGSILRDSPVPAGGASGHIAFKTGTSYGYRDAWALGWDGRRVVGVWVGRPDGVPVPGLVGIEAAAPILLDVFAGLAPVARPPAAPPGVLLARTSELPPTLRQARVRGLRPAAGPAAGPEISFPPDGARLEISRGPEAGLTLKVRNGVPPFTWLADGAPVAREAFSHTATWSSPGPGYTVLSVVDGQGRGSRVRVYLDWGHRRPAYNGADHD